jgi:hypothetical protein
MMGFFLPGLDATITSAAAVLVLWGVIILFAQRWEGESRRSHPKR